MNKQTQNIIKALDRLERIMISVSYQPLRKAFQELNMLLCHSQVVDEKIHTIKWNINDVIERGKARDVKLTETTAHEILDIAIQKHDPNIGINWNVIDEITDNVLKKS